MSEGDALTQDFASTERLHALAFDQFKVPELETDQLWMDAVHQHTIMKPISFIHNIFARSTDLWDVKELHKPFFVEWWNIDGVIFREKFVFLGFECVQDHYDVFTEGPIALDFCYVPGSFEDGIDSPSIFDKDLFWTIAVIFKHTGTTGIRPWDTEINRYIKFVNERLAINAREKSDPCITLCAVCKEPSKLRCSRCKNERYCSTECQRSHWTIGGHKQKCKTGASTRVPLVLIPDLPVATREENADDWWAHADIDYNTDEDYECTECSALVNFHGFSKSQFFKDDGRRRCKECVAATVVTAPIATLFCVDCNLAKPREAFTKSQCRANSSKRKCKDCVAVNAKIIADELAARRSAARALASEHKPEIATPHQESKSLGHSCPKLTMSFYYGTFLWYIFQMGKVLSCAAKPVHKNEQWKLVFHVEDVHFKQVRKRQLSSVILACLPHNLANVPNEALKLRDIFPGQYEHPHFSLEMEESHQRLHSFSVRLEVNFVVDDGTEVHAATDPILLGPVLADIDSSGDEHVVLDQEVFLHLVSSTSPDVQRPKLGRIHMIVKARRFPATTDIEMEPLESPLSKSIVAADSGQFADEVADLVASRHSRSEDPSLKENLVVSSDSGIIPRIDEEFVLEGASLRSMADEVVDKAVVFDRSESALVDFTLLSSQIEIHDSLLRKRLLESSKEYQVLLRLKSSEGSYTSPPTLVNLIQGEDLTLSIKMQWNQHMPELVEVLVHYLNGQRVLEKICVSVDVFIARLEPETNQQVTVLIGNGLIDVAALLDLAEHPVLCDRLPLTSEQGIGYISMVADRDPRRDVFRSERTLIARPNFMADESMLLELVCTLTHGGNQEFRPVSNTLGQCIWENLEMFDTEYRFVFVFMLQTYIVFSDPRNLVLEGTASDMKAVFRICFENKRFKELSEHTNIAPVLNLYVFEGEDWDTDDLLVSWTVTGKDFWSRLSPKTELWNMSPGPRYILSISGRGGSCLSNTPNAW